MTRYAVKAITMIRASISALFLFYVSLLGQPKQITILHTNDMHASFLPHEAYWVRESPKPLVGGFDELAFAVDSVRKTRISTLILDAGDLMTGNPITDRSYKGAEGGALIEMLNMIGYEAWTPGNHDFDISYANFQKLAAVARFPVLSANLVDEATGQPITRKEYIIIEKNGVKIGIFALMSKEYFNLVSQTSTKGIKLLPCVEVAKRMVEILKPKTDLVIALTHQGVDDDSVLAANTTGIDVVIGGHSHTRLRKPKFVNNVVIAQTGSNAENLGILDLTVENHRVISFNGILHQLWFNPNHKPTVVSALADSFKTEIKKEYSEVIGTLSVPWNIDGGENHEGYFLADAQRGAAKADFGIMNRGGIRKRLIPGPITKQDLFEVLPFRNILVTFSVTGKQLREIVKNDIEKRPGIIFSGLQCEWKRDATGTIQIVTLAMKGKLVDDNAAYVGAASDYLMGESKRHLGIETPPLTFTDQTVFGAVEHVIRSIKLISTEAEASIKEIK
jgi:2',3'-cyclic-nucleotide 2'-phosphodiesterase (5'-nucleotidase family)